MTKEELFDKYAEERAREMYPGDFEDFCSHMDEYAKQQCLDLLKWKWDNVESDGGYPDDKRFITYDNQSLTAEQLYNLFINNPSK